MNEEIEYYPPPNQSAAKIWPTREEQSTPCHKCGQLPVMGLSPDGSTISISHCMCPSLTNTRRTILAPCGVCGGVEYWPGYSSKDEWFSCCKCWATFHLHNNQAQERNSVS